MLESEIKKKITEQRVVSVGSRQDEDYKEKEESKLGVLGMEVIEQLQGRQAGACYVGVFRESISRF